MSREVTRHLTLVTAGGSLPLPPAEPDPSLVDSYADLALALEAPHGLDCPCLICGDKRVEMGIESNFIDPWDLLGARWLA